MSENRQVPGVAGENNNAAPGERNVAPRSVIKTSDGIIRTASRMSLGSKKAAMEAVRKRREWRRKVRKAYKYMLAVAAGVMLAAEAVVVRKLPGLTVVENETIATDAMKATIVRTSNSAVFGAALRESGEALVSGARLGGQITDKHKKMQSFFSKMVRMGDIHPGTGSL